MGYLLKRYMEYIANAAGPMGKARLVLMTGITENMAFEGQDTNDRVTRIRKAIVELTGREAPVFELPDKTGDS